MKGKVLIFVIAAVLAGLQVSCQNLPSKVVVAPDAQPTEAEIVSPETSENAENFQPEEMIVRQEWSEPEAGPTVTPIVLPIEKRGEEAGAIIRTVPTAAPETYSSVSQTGSQPSYNAPVGMKDDMEVVGFKPVNNAIVLPNQALHLDVTLRNTGTTTWMTDYRVVDISAQPMTIDRVWYMPYMVGPGDSGMLSIYMAAPQELGSYTASFRIEDAYGAAFGTFEYTLTVGAFSSVTDIPTLTATVTPTYYSAEGITATPDELWWMCTDLERSKLQDCYSFCVEYSDRPEFRNCFYDGIRYETPVP